VVSVAQAGLWVRVPKRSPVPSRLLLLIKEIENIKMPLDAGYFESPVRGKRTMMQIIVWVRILEIPTLYRLSLFIKKELKT
jgi:hypothetical protein